ncbi:MAG: hypothetical protein QXP71_02980 [Desulfurococcaceae archaeon]
MIRVKETGLIALALLLMSIIIIPIPSLTLSINDIIRDDNENVVVDERTGLVVFLNISLSDMLRLAYIVRNVSMPLLEWSRGYNVSLANVIIRLGDEFLERAINESSVNETRAKIYAFVSAVIYAHAPATAHPVLARTIRENVGENFNITNRTVLAIYNRTLELSSLLENAKNIVVNYNLTISDRVRELEIIASGLVNISLTLLNEGFTGRAFGMMIRAYNTYTRAYSFLIKSIFAQILGIRLDPRERLTNRFTHRIVVREILERVIDNLPKVFRERIREKVRNGEIKNWEDLRREVRREIEECRRYIIEKNIDIVSSVLVQIIRLLYYRGDMLNKTLQDAVEQWLSEEGMLVERLGFGRKPIDENKLREYLKDLVRKTYSETGYIGLELLKECINRLESIIRDKTSISVDLDIVLYYISQLRHG